MAYKPKYAQTKSVPGKTEKVQPIPKQDASVQKQKKMMTTMEMAKVDADQ